MKKTTKLLLSLSLVVSFLAVSTNITSAASQTVNLKPAQVSDGTGAFSEFFPAQYLDNIILSMASHPTRGTNTNFPAQYKLTQKPRSQSDTQANYMGLYSFNSSGICSGATIQSLKAKLNYTASVDSDPQEYNFTSNTGGTDVILTIWNGTQRLAGSSNPDLLVGPQDPYSNYSVGAYVYDNPINTAHQLDYTSTNVPANTNLSNIQVGLGLQQMMNSNFDDVTINDLSLDITYDDSTCSSPTLYCPTPGNTSQVLTPAGDCDGDGITNQTEDYDPDGDGNPNTGTKPVDTDHDGIPDYLDLDSDNDGILDNEEKGTASDSSTKPADTDKDGTPDFRDLDSDNDSTKDVLESGRNNLDTNNDGRIDGTTNTYGIPSSAASTTNPKTLASTSLKDSDNNGTPDYRQSSRNGVSVLAKTGESTITALALATLSLVGAVLAKARRVRV